MPPVPVSWHAQLAVSPMLHGSRPPVSSLQLPAAPDEWADMSLCGMAETSGGPAETGTAPSAVPAGAASLKAQAIVPADKAITATPAPRATVTKKA